MAERRLTEEQRAAIGAEGEVLVSASAGSGKTFVMIERMVSLVLSGKAEASGILAVTFTNLAAGEMKERLRAAIVARVNEESDPHMRAHLKEQLLQIGTADISTVHSFCTSVIRRYFYEADVSGSFRVLDDAEAEKLKSRAVARTFDRLLESGDEGFALLSSAFAGTRGFGRLREIVLESYEKTVSKADPAAFLGGIPALYDDAHFAALCEELFSPVRARAEKLRERCKRLAAAAEPFVRAGVMGEKHLAFLSARAAFAEQVLAAEDAFAAAAAAEGVSFPSKPPNTKVRASGDPAALALDGELVACKEEAEKLREALKGTGAREGEREKFYAAGRVAAALSVAVLAFSEAYAEEKRRAGALDFADLEHKCLALLENPQVRAEVAGRYTHVFVDEYQDVNPVQERILSLVAGKNVFMVGDAKQSIYGFRGCSSAFFTQKFERLSAEGRALTLNANFRSRTAVLDAVNRIFSKVMTRENGAVDYAATAMMRAGTPEQAGGAVHVAVARAEEKEEPLPRGVYSVAEHIGQTRTEEYPEGALIADIVLEELRGTLPDAESEGGRRGVGYGDIVVLTRNKTGRAGRIVAELVRRGIPVATEAEVNVCDYPEVKNLLGILQFLDNGSQDIPLAAALKSGLGGMTDGDLAEIRLAAGAKVSFVAACAAYAQGEGERAARLRAFYAAAERLRLLLPFSSAAELCVRILRETGMELALLASPCGEEKLARVRRFIAESGELGVAEFLERLKNTGYFVGFSEKGGENAVRVMTMHKAKGLEFPIVIVAGLTGEFGSLDLRGVLFDDEWGFAPCAYDLEKFTAKETILRAVCRNRIRRRRAEDEMRLLYVALTRARERLWLAYGEEPPAFTGGIADAGCFADFIDLADFEENIVPVFGEERGAPAARVLLTGEPDEEARRAVSARYRREYPFAASCSLPVKTSATALLHAEGATGELLSAGEGAEQPAERTDAAREDAAEGLSPADAETGVAYHAFLERADFSAPPAEETARVLARMREEGFAVLPDPAQAEKILRMPLFASLEGAALRREQPFLVTLPANLLYGTPAEDGVLVQGFIDLLALRGEECVVVDYKYSARGEEQLLEAYAPQMRVYAAAASRIAGVKRVRAFLVNILRGFCVEFPLGEESAQAGKNI